MLEAIIAGQSDPARLAELASARIKASPQTLARALDGRPSQTHRVLLRLHLDQIDATDRSIAVIDQHVEAHLAPFRTAVEQIMTIPGMGRCSTTAVLGETGIDMSRFPSEGQFLSWACLVPRNDESAGKRRSSRLRPGANWLKTTMVQGAWAAVRNKNCKFHALFHRLKPKRGARRAICAVAAEMLRTIYHMLKNGTYYEEHRAESRRQPGRQAQAKHLLQRLARMGYAVVLEPIHSPAG